MNALNLSKLETFLVGNKAQYHLQGLALNPLVGKKMKLLFSGDIHCTHCQKKIKKTYAEGLCYPCTTKLASADMCILKPELCHHARGTCRDSSWAQGFCMVPHIVYLSNTSGLKVGITREDNLESRWIDQGAVAGLAMIKVSTRYHSGLLEKTIATLVKDKTDWRKMLKGENVELNLEREKENLFFHLGEELDAIEEQIAPSPIVLLDGQKSVSIEYPVLQYPEKIKSLSFDKEKEIAGTLLGIKGQYFIFNEGVINIRSHTGYKIDFLYEE